MPVQTCSKHTVPVAVLGVHQCMYNQKPMLGQSFMIHKNILSINDYLSLQDVKQKAARAL